MNTMPRRGPLFPTQRPLRQTLAAALLGTLLGTLLGASLAGAALAQTPAAAPQAEPALPYTVRATDKLIVLGRDLLRDPRDWPEVARFNRLRDPNLILPGQVLQIPLRLLKATPTTGRVVSVEGEVRLQGAAASAGMPLREGQRIETGPQGSAVLELSDGTRVKVLPASLAEVVTQRDYALRDAAASASTTWFSGLIRLSMGTVEALAARLQRRATPLQVETPTSLVGVRGTQFRVAYDNPATRNSRAEVLEGEVRADNTAQQTGTAVSGGFGVVVDPASRDMAPVRLLPAPDLSAWSASAQQPLTLPDPALAGASAYRVQVARDAGFDAIARDLRLPAGRLQVSDLPPGTWHVRVRGIDARGLEGLDSARQVALSAPAPVVPPRPLRVTLSTANWRQGATELQWRLEGLSADAAVRVTLARDASLANPIRSETVSGGRWSLGTLAAGTYHLRFELPGTAGGEPRRSDLYLLDISPDWGVSVFESSFALQPLQR